ncbi:sugar-binding transcriptional regulator [Pseudactinotalea sp. Z1748]|uniref:sugar-binding transcriptional regulator n=1 Tax=Pseudactinotalea sp. Z1748 TaxID=3413027 RepID=UPI003C7D59E2
MSKVQLETQMRCAYAAMQHLRYGRSLIEIAEELGISRFKVARMVKEARNLGLVEVRLHVPDHVDTEMSYALARRFGLRSAVVVATSVDEPVAVREQLGRVGARVVAEAVHEDDVVGVTPGRTIAELCQAITQFPTCDLVQVTGVAATDWEKGMQGIMSLGALAGSLYPLHGPFVTTDESSARVIASQPSVARSLRKLEHLDKAVLSIGGWPDGSLLATQLEELGELRSLRERVVGEIGTTLLDADGQVVDAIQGRVIGITTEQLAAIPVRMGVAGGPGKRKAVRAALRSGLIDVLVTDVRTARYAMEGPGRIGP